MPTSERRSSRTAAIEAALELYAERADASLDQIAERAGIGRATLFRHFENRTALMRAAGIHVVAQLDSALAAAGVDALPAADRLRGILRILVDAGLSLHAVFAIAALVDDAELEEALELLDTHIAPAVEACREQGLLRHDIPEPWSSAVFDALLYAAWSEVHAGRLAPATAADHLFDTLCHGLGPRSRA